MDILQLASHPNRLDKDTLYELRALLALYPYHQPARLLMLRNLFLLHDPSFDRELRKAAIYITDRKKIFELVEAVHYQLRHETTADNKLHRRSTDRTGELIDIFLDSQPTLEEEVGHSHRQPTPADAAVDYVSYLLHMEEQESGQQSQQSQLRGQELIDEFINSDVGRIQLKDEDDYEIPQPETSTENDDNEVEEGYMTENLAKIYIKQGSYSKALEIIKRINLNNPKKNAYFADQIRYLEKLILNERQKKQQKDK